MNMTDDQKKAIQKLLWDEKYIIYQPVKGKCSITKNKRFGTWVFKGSNSKNSLKQFLAFERDYKCIAQIQDVNGFRQFIPFKSWQQCWDAYKTTGFQHRYLYEVIISDNYCKPYLDIEWKTKDDEDAHDMDFTGFIDKLQNDLIDIFNTRYHIPLDKTHILIANAHGEHKVSFHVIINCVINNTYHVYQTNRKQFKNTAWDLYKALIDLDPDYKTKIDESVYSLDREFRALYSTKYEEFRQFKPYGDKTRKFCDNYLDYFITHFNPDHKFAIIETEPFVSPKIQQNKKQKVHNIVGHHIKDAMVNNTDKPDQDLLNRFYELLQFIHPTAYFTGMTANGAGWRFSYHDRTEVCYTGRVHKSNGFSIFLKPSNGDICMYCYSSHCGKVHKLGNLHYDDTWKREAIKFNQQFLEFKTGIPVMSVLDTENVKMSGLLNNFVEHGGCWVIKSRMGTGKTCVLKEMIRTKLTEKRILYLSHRQTFTQNVFGGLKDLGFYNYLDGVQELHTKNKVIVQVDSIVHLLDDEQCLNFYDVIILDEIESLLSHLSSPTIADKRTMVCKIMEQLIKGASHVLGMDADFGNRGYEFLTRVKEKPKIIHNEYKSTTKKRYMFSTNADLRHHQILEDLKSGKNVVVVSLSKNTIDSIYEQITTTIKDIQILRYTSMTDDDQKTMLCQVNEIWATKQCVLFSPTIEAGLSFDIEHFDRMYCFLNNGSCSPRSFLQMVGRIRKLKDNDVRCCYDKMMKFVDKRTYIPHVDEVEDMIANNEYLINNYNFVKVNNKKCRLDINKDAFTRVFAYNQLENYEKMVHFMPILKELICVNLDEYVDCDDPNDIDNNKEGDNVVQNETASVTSASVASTHEEIDVPDINPEDGLVETVDRTSKKTTELDEMLDAPLITADECARLIAKKNANKATRGDKLAIEKYRIIKKFKLKPDELTREFAEKWRGKEYVLDNVQYYMGRKIKNNDDQYLNTIRQRIDYIKQLVQVFGFNDLFDTETTVTRDAKMEKRMKASKFLETQTYNNIVTCFCKRKSMVGSKNFSFKGYMILADSLFNEFGMTVLPPIRHQERDDDGNRKWVFSYRLNDYMPHIKNFIKKS